MGEPTGIEIFNYVMIILYTGVFIFIFFWDFLYFTILPSELITHGAVILHQLLMLLPIPNLQALSIHNQWLVIWNFIFIVFHMANHFFTEVYEQMQEPAWYYSADTTSGFTFTLVYLSVFYVIALVDFVAIVLIPLPAGGKRRAQDSNPYSLTQSTDGSFGPQTVEMAQIKGARPVVWGGRIDQFSNSLF